MGSFVKEFSNDCLKETFIFDDNGITYKKGDPLNIDSNEIIYHAYFPYGSIAEIELPFKGMMELYVYVAKTKKKFTFTLKDLSQNGELKSAIKFTKKQMKKSSYSPVVIYKEQQDDSANNLEHIMLCMNCGNVYRYHDDDIRKNREKLTRQGLRC